MTIAERTISAGQVYILDDYRYVQVVAATESVVRFRIRRRVPGSPRGRSTRSMPAGTFRALVRAEVNGEYFPAFADLGGYRFMRSQDERAGLSRHLAERAAYRPFATC